MATGTKKPVREGQVTGTARALPFPYPPQARRRVRHPDAGRFPGFRRGDRRGLPTHRAV